MSPIDNTNHDLSASFDKATDAIVRDIPLLMHGSGDVQPDQVQPESAQLVAALTAQYIAQLVDAAIDSHEMLRDSSTLPSLPPPSLPRKRTPPLPPPPEKATRNKRYRANEDYFDEPLPEPKIRGKDKKEPTDDEWVGATGVEFSESRIRAAYVRGPAALSTQSFIFPICHDVYAYGRVTEIQVSKRSINPLLIDPTMAEMVPTEGRRPHERRAKKKKQAGNEDDSEPEEEDNGEEETDLAWPGMDALLPIHRTRDMDSSSQ